jgi:hypothetical protein
MIDLIDQVAAFGCRGENADVKAGARQQNPDIGVEKTTLLA